MKQTKSGSQVKQRILSGALIGIINGLFGGGGGMIAVPVLIGLLGYPQKEAHATAIAVIAPVCAVSAAAYVFAGCASPRLSAARQIARARRADMFYRRDVGCGHKDDVIVCLF